MKLLSLYIIRKHIGPFIFGFSVIIFIFLVDILIEKASMLLSRDVPVSVIVEILVLSLAWICALSVPMAVLISTLMTFGRLSADNEITAMKASGYGLHQAMFPVMLVGVVLTVALFYFNDRVLPESNWRLELLFRDISKKKPSLQFEQGIFSDDDLIRDYNLLFRKIDDTSDWVYGVTIYDKTDKSMHRSIIAEKATLRFQDNPSRINLVLYNGEIHDVDVNTMLDYTKTEFETFTIRIPYESSELVRRSEGSRGDRSKSIAIMREDIIESQKYVQDRYRITENRIKKRMRDVQPDNDFDYTIIHSLDIDNIKQSPEGNYYIDTSPENPIIEEVNRQPGLMNIIHSDLVVVNAQIKYQNRMLVEIHKKYAIPFACIVFILIGVPLGVKARHGGIAVGGGLSLFFFLLYWAFLILGETLADRRLLDPWLAMWIANILIGTSGLWLTVQMIHETTLIESGVFGFIIKMLSRGQTRTE
ncbi:LptF/LptG family permease [candidate division KSB1 bacterium]